MGDRDLVADGDPDQREHDQHQVHASDPGPRGACKPGETRARAAESDESAYSLHPSTPRRCGHELSHPHLGRQDLNRIVALDASTPTVGDGEALVAIDAAPVNNADILFAAGWFGDYPDVPSDLGAEGVGRVVRVGAGVDRALVGRRVLVLPTFTFGTWAQETVVPAGRLIPVPEDVDALQLATLPVEAATAYALVHDYVALSPGDWIGLNLANSTVGHYLIPLAKRAGIRTLAVVRREAAAEQVRQLGADVVLVDGDDLTERATAALDGASMRLLREGTGDPAEIAKPVGLVEENGSVVAFASATGQARSFRCLA
jgi:NADPH:quinone reductase-like Zn-dependent oxidoreductase